MQKLLALLLTLFLVSPVAGDYSTSRQGSSAAASVSSAAFPLLAPLDSDTPEYSFATSGGGLDYFSGDSSLYLLWDNAFTGSYLKLSGQSFELLSGTTSALQPSTISAAAGTVGNGGGFLYLNGGAGGAGDENGGSVSITPGAATGNGIEGNILLGGWTSQAGTNPFASGDITNATTTFSNLFSVTHLLVAGSHYKFEMTVFLDNATDANGAKFDFNGGTAAATTFRVQCRLDDTAAPAIPPAQSTTLATAINITTVTGVGMVSCFGYIQPSSSGSFVARFASRGAATTLTAFKGSNLVAQQLQ